MYRAEDIRESASFRPPQAVETVYRSAQLYEPDDDPDEVTQEILVDLDEIDQTMVLHPAVEKCISYTVEDPKSGVDIRSNVVLAPGELRSRFLFVLAGCRNGKVQGLLRFHLLL